jgi:DNA-binding Lrp family transcriptional regulator
MTKPNVVAYVLAVVKRGTEHETAEKIREIRSITEVLITYGMWDLIIRIESRSLRELDNIISDLRKLPEIETTNTLIGT